MPTKRVMAYFMHEAELAAAKQEMAATEVTDSYLIGDVDETRIDALREKGLIVQELQPVTARVPFPHLHGVPRNLRRRALAGARAFGPGAPPDAEEIAPDMSRAQYFFLWLDGPLLESTRE